MIVLCVALMLTYRTMEEQLVYDSKMSVEWLQERLEMEIEDYTRTFYEFEIDKDFRSALSQWCLQGDELNYSSKLELITGLNQTVSINRNINAIELYNLSRDKALIAERLQYVFHRYGRPAGAVALPRRGAPEQSGVPEKRQGDTSHAPDAPV